TIGFSMAREQEQFLDVVDRDTAERRWWSALRPEILASEEVRLACALGRVLASDVIAGVDVPPFDRSNVDGFAVRAQDTVGAAEGHPGRVGGWTTRRCSPASGRHHLDRR